MTATSTHLVPGVELRRVPVGDVTLNVALAGNGPAVLLLHGFPHTWRLWSRVIGPLAARHRVIAPDLRGFGASDRPTDGYDAATLAGDAEQLLAALGETSASVVAIDAGVPGAFLLALGRPALVRRLVLMESLLGTLPGAEGFLAHGAPWWFGFHAVPGLAESVLTGNEERYIGWFLDAGTLGDGVPDDIRADFVAACTGGEALRSAFSYYRALPESDRQLHRATATGRLTMPVMAVGAHPVGDTLSRQLAPLTDDLTSHQLEDCGHIVPLHRPRALLDLVVPFLGAEAEPAADR
ncbi:alpha/beta fold hydrolase [Streptantibioticus cattleyicolor]|uniref:Hydrolase n=1 Tax=Streptantibioticus cattleyicolor (strain ATCC 35852 / DSM 46488 / JCM 4925 / NBRC 14057 / NRRL 8057) TaxID=1003195 RepID=F8JMP6_STREN|nr:alpha/beta fold hydrolase [Streptantibioticus cattleyicolor]AEW98749.1 hydrolase [Streptantibioticus cattleyicolor NRRL 8057 = DSM 46488]CCB72199.1 putative hydrolase [Streptantibioticus cattleyicolor NRRL 8057 = DSM 46488]